MLDQLKQVFPKAEVVGHRDLDKYTACPSFNVKAWHQRKKGVNPQRIKQQQRQRPEKQKTDSIDNELSFGCKGFLVKELQRQLLDFYPVPCHGFFGQQTRAAVKFFQIQKGLLVDGVVGPKTWSRLSRLNAVLSYSLRR